MNAFLSAKTSIVAVLFAIILIGASTCTETPPSAPGETLARQYCSSCHQFPAPRLLPRRIWVTEVLPDMAAFYGIYRSQPRSHYLNGEQEAQYLTGIYPTQAAIDSVTWDSIVAFYVEQSPLELAGVPEAPVIYEIDDFTVQSVTDTSQPLIPPLTTSLHYSAEDQRLFVGSLFEAGGAVRVFTLPELNVVDRFPTNSPPVAFDPTLNGVLTMGSLTPSDQPLGNWVAGSQGQDTILTGLTRPLDFARCDLDLDERLGSIIGTSPRELIVAEYGNMTGKLSAFSPASNKSTILAETPGAIKLAVEDIDQDGNDDLLVLFAQGDERIEAWLARPGKPERKLLYRFPPSYGSADLKVVDFDGDGDLDLLHVCGDNYDYQPVTKPYHGIRLLRNDGNLKFTEAWFYHLNGAYGVEVDDFDQDGDQDLAAIAYFVPPAERATRSFVYLEQTAPLAFKSESFAKAREHNFICMTKGDVDLDGDQDIILGNFATYLPDGMPNTRRVDPEAPVLMWLENKVRN